MSAFPGGATLTVGGRVFTDLTNLIILYGISTSGGRYSTPRLPNATSGYTPSGSKKFRLVAMRIVNDAANADTSGIQIGYGDTDLGFLGAGPTINGIYLAGSGLAASNNWIPTITNPAVNFLEFAITFDVLNTKFPVVYNASTALSITPYLMFGYEV